MLLIVVYCDYNPGKPYFENARAEMVNKYG